MPVCAQAQATDFSAEGAGIVRKLAAGEFTQVVARFDPYMTRALPADQLAAQWKELLQHAGAFVNVGKTAVTQQPGGYHSVAMTVAFERAAQNDALVVFDKSGHIAGLYFGPQPQDDLKDWQPPSYADVSSFHEIPLTVEDGAWHLPGILTLPNSKGPFPAVVLVPGSPPVDADETVGPNKVFKDLAWGLASRGIASLRYTKRTHQFGAGLGGGQISSFSLGEELGDDARAAFSLVFRRKEIDQSRIFLLGHSLGGIAVGQIASSDSRVAGIAVMGTPGGDLLLALIQRSEREAAAGGEQGQQAAAAGATLKKVRDRVFVSGDVVDLFGQRNPASFWDSFRDYQPGSAAAQLKIPVLVAVAKHDAQVPPDDFAQWQGALAGRAHATVKLYPSLFHLFMPSVATGAGDSPEDWGRPSHVDATFVNDVATWVLSARKR